MRQRIELLAMTKLELADMVQTELTANPVLDEVAPGEGWTTILRWPTRSLQWTRQPRTSARRRHPIHQMAHQMALRRLPRRLLEASSERATTGLAQMTRSL